MYQNEKNLKPRKNVTFCNPRAKNTCKIQRTMRVPRPVNILVKNLFYQGTSVHLYIDTCHTLFFVLNRLAFVISSHLYQIARNVSK